MLCRYSVNVGREQFDTQTSEVVCIITQITEARYIFFVSLYTCLSFCTKTYGCEGLRRRRFSEEGSRTFLDRCF